jgi:hypothetical protein
LAPKRTNTQLEKAKPWKKRRSIILGARAESAAALDLLNLLPVASVTGTSDETPSPADTRRSASGASSNMMTEQLAELRRMNAELGDRLHRQVEQLQHVEQHGLLTAGNAFPRRKFGHAIDRGQLIGDPIPVTPVPSDLVLLASPWRYPV